MIRPYRTLRYVCEQLDDLYRESSDPNIGFRLGHYDDERLEIQLYDVDGSRIPELRSHLDAVFTPYDLFQSFIANDTWVVMIRPKIH